MKELLSPKQVATSIGVSESSLKRWCDQGVITTERTPGGHRRIRLGEVVRFLRESQHPIVKPDVLGLPVGTGANPRSFSRANEALIEALVEGDPDKSRRLIIDLYLSGAGLVEICEELVTPALHRIGDGWECGSIEVFQEHRASEILNRVLYELRSLLPPPPPEAPVALGGTPPGDNYRLALMMVELILVSEGWNAVSLGSSLPFSSMAAAAQSQHPNLFWLSFSHVDDQDTTRAGFVEFLDSIPPETTVFVGGQQLAPKIRELADGRRLRYCENLREIRPMLASLDAD